MTSATRPPTPEELWSLWRVDPIAGVLLLLTILLFVRGRRRMGHRPTRRARDTGFVVALLILALALFSPVEGLSGVLLSIHMVQHILLTLVVAPLLVWSRPSAPLLLAIPEPWGHTIGQGWRRSAAIQHCWHVISRPYVATLLYMLILWLWHAPALYQAALRIEYVHILEHATLLGSASLLWWSILYRKRSDQNWLTPLGLLFLTALHSGLLGLLLTFSPSVWYEGYGFTTRLWGSDPLSDQQLAGSILWIPSGLVYLGVALTLLYRWLEGDRANGTGVVGPTRGATLFLFLLLLSGCSGAPRETTSLYVEGGNPQDGWALAREKGCGSCHQIPGVPGADALVGPPLDYWAERRFIAGIMPNQPENLVAWIRAPQAIRPGSAMPTIEMSDEEARDIAAYLFLLRLE